MTDLKEAIDALFAQLDRTWDRPVDWDAWRVLADALEDAGEARAAAAVRWMTKHAKRPYRSDVGVSGESPELRIWYADSYYRNQPGRQDVPSDLPGDLWELLPGPPHPLRTKAKAYQGLRAAVVALAEALGAEG